MRRAGTAMLLAALEGRCDLVFVDAPCSGTGTWRRNPDAKWRMRPGALAIRIAEQGRRWKRRPIRKATRRIVYVTCSLLREENEDRIAAFLGTHADYKSLPVREMVELAQLPELERLRRALVLACVLRR